MLITFSPPPGLDSDDTTFKAEGRWASCNNVRWVNGSPQVIGPFKTFFASTLTGTLYNMFAFSRSGSVAIAYGTDSKLYVGTGSAAPSDRTPAGLGTIYSWSFGEWGSTLLASPGNGKLYTQVTTGTAAVVTQAPAQITTMLVTPQRQVLALGCNEEISTNFNPLCIRGSDLEDYTNWTTTSADNVFEHILDGPGAIVAAKMVGEYVGVWTTSALYLGQFIGDPNQTYKFDRVAEINGPPGANAVTVLDAVAFWLGEDFNIWTWAPGSPPARVPCTVSAELKAARPTAASNRSRIVVQAVHAYKEIWITPLNLQADGTLYYAFSAETGQWFKGDLLRSAVLSSGALASVTSDGSTTLMADNSGGNASVYEHDMIQGVGATGPTTMSLTSGDQYLSNSQRRVLMRSYHPDTTGDVVQYDLTLYVRDRPMSSATTKGPYAIATNATKKDLLVSGMIMSIKYSIAGGLCGGLRFGKALFDSVPMGER